MNFIVYITKVLRLMIESLRIHGWFDCLSELVEGETRYEDIWEGF